MAKRNLSALDESVLRRRREDVLTAEEHSEPDADDAGGESDDDGDESDAEYDAEGDEIEDMGDEDLEAEGDEDEDDLGDEDESDAEYDAEGDEDEDLEAEGDEDEDEDDLGDDELDADGDGDLDEVNDLAEDSGDDVDFDEDTVDTVAEGEEDADCDPCNAEDEGCDDEDLEGSVNPRSQPYDTMEPGKPSPVSYFGGPPDAGSSYASYKCPDCKFSGVTAISKRTASYKAAFQAVRREAHALTASFGVDVDFVQKSDSVVVRLQDGNSRDFTKFANKLSEVFDVRTANKSMVEIGVQANTSVFCPCCSTPMKVSASFRQASLAGKSMNLVIAGSCKKHKAVYQQKGDKSAHLFCASCGDEIISNGDNVVTVPVLAKAELDALTDMSSLEMTLHCANSDNPHWNVLHNGTPFARIELQAQARPMETRTVFVTDNYRKSILQAMSNLGIDSTLESQNAKMYVAKANASAEIKRQVSKLAKVQEKRASLENEAFTNEFLDNILVASQGFDKNMFPESENTLKVALFEALAEQGVSDPAAIVESVCADSIVHRHVQQLTAKAVELMNMDPMAREGQVRLITTAAAQVPTSTLASRLSANSVAIRPTIPEETPVRRSASTGSMSKDDIKATLKLGGASAVRRSS